MRILLLFTLLFLVFSAAYAQEADSPGRKASSLAVPVVFYVPETRFGFGAAGIHNFYFDRQDTVSPPSQLQLGVAYTQNKQILIYHTFQLFWRQRLWNLRGELGYYRYSFFFFGNGNGQDQSFNELYHVAFPRLRAEWLRKVAPRFYVGPRIIADDFSLDQDRFDPEGQLIQGIVPGSAGGRVTGVGFTAEYDARDHILLTTKGYYAAFSVYGGNGLTASDFDYVRWNADLRYFQPLHKKWTAGVQLLAAENRGEVMFMHMALLGGTKVLRGYYEGRFRDKSMLALQTELRYQMLPRWGLRAFGGAGAVGPVLADLQSQYTRWTAGGGLRFMLDKEKRVNIRLDMGFGPGSSGFYFTFGEAF